MSGKAKFVAGDHGFALVEGPATALSWLTILPVRGVAQAFDRVTGRRAMNSLPVVGLVLGATGAALVAGLSWLHTPTILIAALCIALWQWLTRMMHLDGLADVGDALGSFGDPERARAILADKYTGALGMGAAVLCLMVQLAGLTAVLDKLPSSTAAALVIGSVPVVARLAGMIPCHRRFSPLAPTGFGALVIGTVASRAIFAWAFALTAVLAIAAGTLPIAPVSEWALVLPLGCAGAASISAGVVLARRFTRRFGGLNGDCIGALIELTTALAPGVFVISYGALVGG